MNIRSALRSLIIVMPLLFCATAQGQPAFPSKPVRIITAAVGGASDFTARMLAQGLGASLGQQFIVDNRGGANGIIAAQMVAKSPPDGYNLLLFTSPIWLLPLLQDNVPYDPVRDFAPIAITDSSPSVLVVHPSLPVKNVKELIDLAKAKPGEITYSHPGVGNTGHIAGELLNAVGKVKTTGIPYKGTAPSVIAVLSGEAQLTYSSIPTALPYIRAGRLRALGVGNAKRMPSLPEFPTVAEAGLPGYEAYAWGGMLGPAKMPVDIVNRLSREIVASINSKDVTDRMLNEGTVPTPSSPEEFAAYIKSEIQKWGVVIRGANIRVE